MPRGDGTGPLGTGPLNRKSGNGRGRGPGRRLNKDCATKDTGKIIGRAILPGSSLKISTLLMGIASVALPALVKMREILAERKTDKLISDTEQASKTITIKAEDIELQNNKNSKTRHN